MSYCPSHDWDRYVNEQDEAVAAEVAFLKTNADKVLQVVCAAIASGKTVEMENMDGGDIRQLVTKASEIVLEINRIGEDY